MPGSSASVEADEGGSGSDDESGMRGRGSVSHARWSRMTETSKGWRLRGVEWRVKLGILPGGNASVDAMRRATADGRRKYADLRRRLLVDPHVMDEDQTPSHLRMDNPLSLDPDSVWGRYFRNAELEKTIDKDLTRLYPEHGAFFQSAPCQAMMRRILLVWSLIHPQFSYRQGMHELLAPLLYVLHVDVVRLSQVKHRFEDLFDDRFDSLSLQEQHVRDKVESAKNFCGEMIVAGDSINFKGEAKATTDGAVDPEEQRVDLSEIIHGSDMYGVEGELGALLSARFLEHDAYCMLDALLSGQDGALAMADYFTSSGGGGKPPVIEASAVVYRTLAAADISLYAHLVELGVEPQFFALRWLRLLFGREFGLEDLLRVWDAIFGADNTPLHQLGGEDGIKTKVSQRAALISSFSVSMLLYVRPALLAAADVTGCLQRLLNFPHVPDVRDLIESAQSLQLLAQAVARSPSTPVPWITRASEIRGNVKHARSGSVSPPTPQRHVMRPLISASSSPDVLRLSMSLPGSYWEEKWTHSVLQKKTPEELFSPRTCRTESVARGSDNVDREGSDTGVLNRSTSEGPTAPNSSIRRYDSSQESSDDYGQEMLRRGVEASSQDAAAKDPSLDSTVGERDGDGSCRASGSGGQELRDPAKLNSLDHVSSASALEQGYSSGIETLQDNFAVLSEATSVESLERAEVANGTSGSMGILERGQVSESVMSNCRDETDEKLEDGGPIRAVIDTCPTSLESINADALSSIIAPRCEGSSALPSGSATTPQPILDIKSTSGTNESLEVKEKSQDEESHCDSPTQVTSSENFGMESKVEKDVEEIKSGNLETPLRPSKSKPPLPPGKLGRFNWMWTLGRNSFHEKTVTNKEDTPGNEVVPTLSGSVSDSEVITANAAQRRKKSWWRANSDVVPEDCVATTSNDLSIAVAASDDLTGPVDLLKPVAEPVVTASEEHLEGDMVAEMPVSSQEALKKSKDLTPSAALQALGQSMLEHVQVLESALAQKVSVLGIENMMWTPAVRDKAENSNKGGLGGKGQGAAVAAIAELRKISQALQQM